MRQKTTNFAVIRASSAQNSNSLAIFEIFLGRQLDHVLLQEIANNVRTTHWLFNKWASKKRGLDLEDPCNKKGLAGKVSLQTKRPPFLHYWKTLRVT